MVSRTPKNGAPALGFVHHWRGGAGARLEQLTGAFAMGFAYDPFLRLRGINWFFDAAVNTNERFYDGDDVVLDKRNIDRNNFTPPQYRRYVHGQATDQPLAMEPYAPGAPPTPGTGSVFYYHPDGEGSVRLLTDASGQVANRYDYDSFGRHLTVVESAPQPFSWKGREYIPGPDIVYNRARFYDPLMGRFVEEDPLGYDGGDSNLYAFAWNNIRNWNDPSGLVAAIEEAEVDNAAVRGIVGGGTVGLTPAIATEALAVAISKATRNGLQRIGACIALDLFILADEFNSLAVSNLSDDENITK